MRAFDDEELVGVVFAVVVEVTGKPEPAARHQLAIVATTLEQLAARLRFFHAQLGQRVAVGQVPEPERARVLVGLDDGNGALPVQRRRRRDDRAAALEVVAAHGDLAVHELAHGRPVADAVFLGCAAVALEWHVRAAVDRLRQARIVSQHQLVFPLSNKGEELSGVIIPICKIFIKSKASFL